MSELIANRYELGSVVGSGGMSVVYSATDTLLGHEIAVKILHNELTQRIGLNRNRGLGRCEFKVKELR